MEYLIGGIIGFLIGLVIGIFLVCICVANGKDEMMDMKLEPSEEFKNEMGCFVTHDQAEEIDKLYLEKCKKLSEIEKVAKSTKTMIQNKDTNSCMEALKTIIEILED